MAKKHLLGLLIVVIIIISTVSIMTAGNQLEGAMWTRISEDCTPGITC